MSMRYVQLGYFMGAPFEISANSIATLKDVAHRLYGGRQPTAEIPKLTDILENWPESKPMPDHDPDREMRRRFAVAVLPALLQTMDGMEFEKIGARMWEVASMMVADMNGRGL